MRKLASIQRIWDIVPIEGADRIELAKVLGWQCVVNKGQFEKYDMCVYFEIDSFLPIRPEFEFLRKSSYKDNPVFGEGFRLKTQTFRKQISQGLVLPLTILPEGEYALNQDVTEILGVRKWEIEEKATTGGTVVGGLPSCVPFTDETRVQACPALINEFKGKGYYITTKMDGSSHSICIDADGAFHVTGRNYEYKDDGTSSFYEFVKKKEFESRLRPLYKKIGCKTIVVQGEFCAPGIQLNRLRLEAPEWYVFTVIIDGKRQNMYDTFAIAKTIWAEHVPLEETGNDFTTKYPTVEAVLARAVGQYPNGGAKEGIVIRTVEPEYCELISAPLSMKAVNNKYLLKEK